LWKSSDGGETLEQLVTGFVSRRVVDAVASAGDAYVNTVQDGGAGGLYRSENGGRSWDLAASAERMGDQHLHLLAADPDNPDLILTANQAKLTRSADGGKSWKPVAFPPKASGDKRIQAIAAFRTPDGPLFLAGTESGLWKSSDGLQWKSVALSAAKIRQDVRAIRVSPKAGRVVIQTAQTLYLSQDGGDSWKIMPILLPTSIIYDVALGDDPGQSVLLATARGLYRSIDSGRTWAAVTQGLAEGTVNSVVYEPGERANAYVAQFGQVFRSKDGGVNWTRVEGAVLEEATIRRLWFHPGQHGRMFALTPDLGVFYLDLPTLAVHNK
jgi:photosystem II stability/assembly factor-like uncharacterized protein